MPFDFTKYKHYYIDYSSLFNEFNSKKILSNADIQTTLLRQWMKALKDADDTITEELKTQDSINKLKLLLQSEPEIFQIPMYYESNQILIHFRVSIANSIFLKYYSKALFIELNEFTRKNSIIKWTPLETDFDSYLALTEPIIMVPFLNRQYNYLVIDGNHRITSRVKNNIDNIYALIVDEQTVIEQAIFSSGFDKLYYIMNNELNYMANETEYKDINPMDLVQKSYLNGEKFKF